MNTKPVSEIDVADVASQVVKGLRILHREGKDGKDVALGALSAIRSFTLEMVGVEKYREELKDLAEWFKGEL